MSREKISIETMAVLYESVAPKYPNKVMSREMVRLLKKDSTEFNRDNYLATLLSYLKYMNEDDIMFWGVDAVEIIKSIEDIFNIKGLLNVLKGDW